MLFRSVAFLGIGSPTSASNVIWTDGLKSEYITSSFGNRIIGETCTRFYDKNGNEVPTEVVDRTISIPFSQLSFAITYFPLTLSRFRETAVPSK